MRSTTFYFDVGVTLSNNTLDRDSKDAAAEGDYITTEQIAEYYLESQLKTGVAEITIEECTAVVEDEEPQVRY